MLEKHKKLLFSRRGEHNVRPFLAGKSQHILLCVLIVALFASPACLSRKKPEKVWNIRGKMVGLAKSMVGLPYQYGGNDLDGFDCSGFVYYIYDCYGVSIPRTAKKQSKMDGMISLKKAKPADILVFKIKRRRWHTAVYIGDNAFIHAPNKKDAIRVEKLNKYWRKRLKAVIRVVKE